MKILVAATAVVGIFYVLMMAAPVTVASYVLAAGFWLNAYGTQALAAIMNVIVFIVAASMLRQHCAPQNT